MKRKVLSLTGLFVFLLGVWGCEMTPKARVTSGGGPSMAEAQQSAASRPESSAEGYQLASRN